MTGAAPDWGADPDVGGVDGVEAGLDRVAPDQGGPGAFAGLEGHGPGRALGAGGRAGDVTGALEDLHPVDGFVVLAEEREPRVALDVVVGGAAVLQPQPHDSQPHGGVAVVGGDAEPRGRAVARLGRRLVRGDAR